MARTAPDLPERIITRPHNQELLIQVESLARERDLFAEEAQIEKAKN